MNTKAMLLAEAYREAEMLSTKRKYDPFKTHLELSFQEGDFAFRYLQDHLGRIERSFEHLSAQSGLANRHLKILDIGTGFFYHSALRKTFPDSELRYTTDGMDIEQSRLVEEDSSVDIVLLWEVIEHFYRDPMFALGEINRVLKPGGLIFVTTPNLISWVAMLKSLLGYSPSFYGKYSVVPEGRRHVHEHIPDSVGRLLYASGFDTRVWTENIYYSRIGEVARQYFNEAGVCLDDRGDSIFAIGKKESSPRERYPGFIYDAP